KIRFDDLELHELRGEAQEPEEHDEHEPAIPAAKFSQIRALNEEAHLATSPERGAAAAVWWRRSATLKTNGAMSAVAVACGTIMVASSTGRSGSAPKTTSRTRTT